MNCANCGAPMRLEDDRDYLVCDFCGSTHSPERDDQGVRVLGVEDRSQCPVCRVPLVHAAVRGCRLLYCRRCHGFLVAMDTFLQLAAMLRARDGAREAPPPVHWQELSRRIRCPKCSRHMDTHPYGGPGNVIIDNCPHCRVNWLDRNELTRIATTPETRYREEEWVAL